MIEFNIGDRVKSLKYNKTAFVVDKLYSNLRDEYLYTIRFEDSAVPFAKILSCEDIEPYYEKKTYRWEVFQADDNVVTAVMYETVGGVEQEISRKHGHIMHDGDIGVAQAASYAMKKLYIGMNGGKYIGREDEDDVQ